MASRRFGWVDASGAEQAVTFDHGAQCFAPDRPRFNAAMARAMAANCLSEWLPRAHAPRPAEHRQCLVASPTMPVLCSAWVLRNDRVPGRTAPPGLAVWTAHSTAEWSAAHLEDQPQSVNAELQSALMIQLPATSGGGQPVQWHHAAVHHWRYAGPAFGCDDRFDSDEAWWNDSLGLGVCGNFLAGGGVEARHGIPAMNRPTSWRLRSNVGKPSPSWPRQCAECAKGTDPDDIAHPHAGHRMAIFLNHQTSPRLVSPVLGGADPFTGA